MAGLRPKGAVITKKRTRSEYRDVEILSYIAGRSGEYDEVEYLVLSDPYVDGWELYEQGVPIDEIQVRRKDISRAMYKERVHLANLGWIDARDTIKREALRCQ